MKYTDFRQFSHAELRAMVQALNPGEVMAAADPWRRAADTLKAIRTTLTRASTEAATTWEGSTSDAFHTRMLHLATTINTAASYANDAAITLKAVSEAIAEAKRNMPEEPSGWAQFKDGVGDTFSSLFGADDEDARTDLANQKKAEAATVLQTLAMHYRTAAPMLKPPPPPVKPPNPFKREDYTDLPEGGNADTGGYAAVGGFLGGVGVGNPGAGTVPVSRQGVTGVADPRTGGSGRSTSPTASPSASKPPPAPSDPGVKGGVAVPLKGPQVSFGAGAVVDGTEPGSSSTPSTPFKKSPDASSTSLLGSQGSGGNQALPHSPASHPVAAPGTGGAVPHPNGPVQPFTPAGKQGLGSGAWRDTSGPGAQRGSKEGASGRNASGRSGAAFGAEGMPGMSGGGANGAASSRGRGTAGGSAGHAGGTIVGVGDRPGKSSGGKQSFTEGGSGLGARGRIPSEAGTRNPSSQMPLVPLGNTDRGRKDEERKRRRPDYLVEDEETWASDAPTNPNVVE
ncbi:WXG100 family type VII secretion target [Kitasatospora purpeofusca]|uniref:WXG100 family type VII secretion target n=1 Tax=Kitasatospora purpeofusca TaxID=67352 RepID=UPI00381B4C69